MSGVLENSGYDVAIIGGVDTSMVNTLSVFSTNGMVDSILCIVHTEESLSSSTGTDESIIVSDDSMSVISIVVESVHCSDTEDVAMMGRCVMDSVDDKTENADADDDSNDDDGNKSDGHDDDDDDDGSVVNEGKGGGGGDNINGVVDDDGDGDAVTVLSD